MCGICGFTGKSNKINLQKMTSKLTHRGPDEEGFYFNDGINFGIKRLSIVDLETGHQPCFSMKKDIISVFNGEIYNFLELREQLLKKGCKFSSDHSDSELIPHLYQNYGTDFVNLINGMFAIALYDKRKKKLFLIRDRVGKKPLYYALKNGKIFFASEIKALKKAGFGRYLNMDSVYSYFMKKNTAAPLTIYKDIFQIEPATILEFSQGKFKTHKYWDIQFTGNLKLKNEEEYVELLISELKKSVANRTHTDVEFGSYLSGGMDSSLITAMLFNQGLKKIKTFSLVYNDSIKGKNCDKEFSRLMSRKLGTEHYEYELSANEVFNDLPKVLNSFDEPFCGTISTFFLTKLVSKYVKVAFSGDGADELFGSYLTHRYSNPINYLHNFKEIPKFPQLSEFDKVKLYPFNSPTDYEKLAKIYSKDNIKWRSKLLCFTKNDLEKLFNKKIIFEPFKKISKQNKTELNLTLESEFKDQLSNQVLSYIDKLSMAHSVEIRSPYLDYEFIELISKFPSDLKIKNGENKYILKKAALKYLPREIVFRKKEGFVMPNYKWIEKDYFDEVEDIILNSKMISDLNMNKNYIIDIFNELKKGLPHHSKIWSLYNFAIWYAYKY